MKKSLKLVCKPAWGLPLFSLLLVFLACNPTNAQTVTGTISNSQGEKLSGVTVTVKGTSKATTTNASGSYSIDMGGKPVLSFSSVGYLNKDIEVAGRNTVDLTLEQNLQKVDEVVLVALGIKKESRRLGYSTTNVSSEELTVNRSPNMMNALQGKVAGLNISALGTGPCRDIQGQDSRPVFYLRAE
jgi:hypothetical protein